MGGETGPGGGSTVGELLPSDGALREGILEISPVPIAILDADRRVVLANERAEAELGLCEDEPLGLSTTDATLSAVDADGDPVGEDEGITVEILEEGEPVHDRVYRVDMPDGDSVWLSVNGTPLFDDDGEVANIVLAFENITERKERERRFDAVFNNTFQFTGLMEPDGTLIEANDTALAFGGIDREDVIGKRVWETYWFQVDEETPEQVRRDVERARQGEFVRYELEVQGAEDTALIDFSLKPITDERGEVTLIVPEGRDITDLKRRERELREERSFVESMLGALPDIFYAYDTAGNFVRWNDRFTEVTGYADAEIEAMEPLDFVPEDETGPVGAAIDTILEDGEPVVIESALETKAGERIPYEFKAGQWRGPDDEVLGVVGIGRDVTERRERERRFEAIFNQTYQFTGLMEPDGTLIEANDTALEFVGADREDAVGKHLAESPWITESDRDRIYDATERAREGEFVRFETEINGAAPGETVPIDFSLKPVTDEQGEVVLLIPEGRDITELKEREVALREERAFTDSMLAGLPDVLYAFDEHGNFLRWNERFNEVTGYADDEIAEMQPLDFVPDDEAGTISENIAAVVESGEAVTVESYFETKAGERIPYEFTGAPLVDQDGTDLGLVGIGRDITERKRRERELARKTAELERTVDRLERTNAELEQFAYVASHDLQEPLRMISSYLDLLELEHGEALDEEAHEYIDYAVDGADRMREMIDDLLAFSRVQTREEEFEHRSLEAVLGEALDNLAVAVEESGATVTHDDLPTLPVDAHQVRQLFQNLLDNAISYAGDEPPRVHVGATERDDCWAFTVEDEGVGIPEAEQDRIFDIFMRGASSEEGGSGIGLAICKRVVENHGGRIDVNSERGEGTTFRFTLAKQPGGNGGVAP